MFAHDMKWTDDMFMEKMTLERANFQLAMYAARLGTGHTITMHQITCATIRKYVNAVATFVGLLGLHPRDPRKEAPADHGFAECLQAVYKELERYEKVPNRREPFTLEMLRHIKSQVKASNAESTSLLAAMADWSEINLFTGARLGEWAQPTQAELALPLLNIFNDPQAFSLRDLTFADKNRKRMTLHEVVHGPPDLIGSVKLCWRTQKNGDNNETKLYTVNPSPNGRDLVRPMVRVVKRFYAIHGVHSDADHKVPLAIYANDNCSVRLIVARDIEQVMRSAAAAVYNLDPTKHAKELQRWSAHSYRVGACCLLHGLGYNEHQIKFLLRWRSNAFMVYLRNLMILSNQHVRDIDKADAIPHFV
jgi:hypothetical protein